LLLSRIALTIASGPNRSTLMANDELVALLKTDKDAFSRRRQENLLLLPDLSEAYLSGAHLEEADLSEATVGRFSLEKPPDWLLPPGWEVFDDKGTGRLRRSGAFLVSCACSDRPSGSAPRA
jgi:Pentapeptide repeats (8 copies)